MRYNNKSRHKMTQQQMNSLNLCTNCPYGSDCNEQGNHNCIYDSICNVTDEDIIKGYDILNKVLQGN